MLYLNMGALAGEVGIDRGSKLGAIGFVEQLEPVARASVALARRSAQDLVPPRREVDPVSR